MSWKTLEKSGLEFNHSFIHHSQHLLGLLKIFNHISRAKIVTSATRSISKAESKAFNRTSRANIVTSVPRNISRDYWLLVQSQILRQYRDQCPSHVDLA